MKKYNVFSLYVIEKEEHKFICEKISDKEYKEVLTKEKLLLEEKNKVKSLTDYYSIFEIAVFDKNLEVDKVLVLSKKDILLKYIEINEKTMDKESNPPYRVIPFDKNLTEEQMKDVMIDMWQTDVESKKDDMPDIPIISAKELQKRRY